MKNILFLIVFPLFAFLYCQGQAIEVIALSERAVKKTIKKICSATPEKEEKFVNGERYTVICYSNCFNGLILCYLFSHKKCFGWIIVPLNQILLKELVELFNKRSVRLTNAE